MAKKEKVAKEVVESKEDGTVTDATATKAPVTRRPRRSKEEQFRMTDLIGVVQGVTSLSRRESKVAIQAVIYSIKKGVLDKGFVKIPGFGKFIKVHKNATERNSFGKPTKIPAKDIVKFRPLKSLKLLINGQSELEKYEEEAAANASEE